MYYAKDLQTAERVLAELRNTRVYDKAAMLARLQRIRNEVACESNVDRARLQAWTSIRKLYDTFKAAPDRDLKPLWQEAISSTAAWGESLR
jgi:hypothetical protein